MPSISLLDNNQFVPVYPDVSVENLAQAVALDRSRLAGLVNNLLLYETVIIPTTDFSILGLLLSWIGRDAFEEMLKCGALRFVRRPHQIGYVGAGHGLLAFGLKGSPEEPFNWQQESLFGTMDRSIELQLSNAPLCKNIANVTRLSPEVLARSESLEFEDGAFEREVVTETYKDIVGDQSFQNFILTHEKKKPRSIEIRRLGGMQANEMRFRGIRPIKDGVDLVLKVAEVNYELSMGARSGQIDLTTSSLSRILLPLKLKRMRVSTDLFRSITQLTDLQGIPDVGEGVASGFVPLKEVWAVRQSRSAQAFREWFRHTSAQSARDVERAFVESLKNPPWVASLKAKAVRFGVTTLAGIASPLGGVLASGTDSFLLERLIGGYTPRMFFDDLKSLPGLIRPRE